MKQLFLIMLFFYSHSIVADDVQIKLLALFESKAMVSVNGQNKTLKQGDSFSGVKLLEVDTKQAVVEIDGQEQVLQLGVGVLANSLAAAPAQETKKIATLWADDDGFFFANGVISKKSVRFLVDTGANIVAMSSATADSVGLDYKDAPKGLVTTASGQTIMHDIIIKKITIEGIALYNVRAGIIIGNYPTVPLLGMSFLSKLDMQRTGEKMELKKRF